MADSRNPVLLRGGCWTTGTRRLITFSGPYAAAAARWPRWPVGRAP